MDVSGRLLYAQNKYRNTEKLAASAPRDMSGLNRKYREQPLAPAMQYFSSVVTNSHQYPLMDVIRPYGIEYRPVAVGGVNQKMFDNRPEVKSTSKLQPLWQ